MKLIVISGLSGAGKSIAMHVLEDLGYYCVDNLPLRLLPALALELDGDGKARNKRFAVAIDARNFGLDLQRFPEMMQEVRRRGAESEVVFLEADDAILIKRFSETRRRHPLTSAELSLPEALRQERELLQPVRETASIRIDTTSTHLHQLRDIIRERVDQRPLKTLSLMVESFGFKHGVPKDADFVFDVRCLPNPHWEPALRSLTGQSEKVADYLAAAPTVPTMLNDIIGFLERWIPAFEADNRAYLTVAIGCTGGQHRSVYVVEQLGEFFRKKRGVVIVRHRDMPT